RSHGARTAPPTGRSARRRPRLQPLPLVGDLDFSRFRRFIRPLAVLAIASAVSTGAYAATRPAGWYVREWPTAQSERIASAADRSGTRLVFADDRYADWLLWTEPEPRGRIAYDVRFELFRPRQLDLLVAYRNRIGPAWRLATAGYALQVFDPPLQP